MSQETKSVSFIWMKLMNLVLEFISSSNSESSLLHFIIDIFSSLSSCTVYIDNIFSEHSLLEKQYIFFRDHFFLWIEWVKLRLFFQKLWLFVKNVQALEITHKTERSIKIVRNQIQKIIYFSKSKNQTDVWFFMNVTNITQQWVKNFREIAQFLNHLLDKMNWRWKESEILFFELLKIKYSTAVIIHDINWSLSFHLYTDTFKYKAELDVMQFQIQSSKKSVEILILFDFFMFTTTKHKYLIYKWELCIMIHFCFKYDYMLRNSVISNIVHMNHKSLVQFLISDLHDDIYEHWAIKMRELNLKIEHISEYWNKIINELSQTFFQNLNCVINSNIRTVKVKLNEKDFQ